MFKSKLKKAFVLGVCIMALSNSLALANTGGGLSGLEQPATGQFVAEQPLEIPEVILEEQRKIDQYVFEDHRLEIEQKGFMITHTGPMQDYVEVGISPYSDENANYLYEMLGREKMKVVEGQQAKVLSTPDVVPISAPDTSVSSSVIDASSSPVNLAPATDIAAANVNVTSEALKSAEQEQSASSTSPFIYGAGAVVILGGVIASRKLRMAKR